MAHYENVYTYTEMGNLIRVAVKHRIEEMLIPPDGVIFERPEEPEIDDEWIEL